MVSRHMHLKGVMALAVMCMMANGIKTTGQANVHLS